MEELLHKVNSIENDVIDEIYRKIQTLQEQRSCVVVYGESFELTHNFRKCLIQDVSAGKHSPVYKFTDHSSELDMRHDDDEKRSHSFIHNPGKNSKAKISHRRRRLPLEDTRENENGSTFQESVNILVLPELMNDDIMSEVQEAHPTSFVFIMNGATTERTQHTFQRVVSKIYYMCSRDDKFDPSSAMFVIHTDNVSNNNLKHSVLETFQQLWPGVCDQQIHLETLIGNFEIESAPFTPSHALIESFYVMIQETEHRKIRRTYLWLKSSIMSATIYIRSLIGQCVNAEEELESHHSAILERQEKLTQVYTDGIEILEVGVETKTQSLKESILTFLDTTSFDFKQTLKELKFSVDTMGAVDSSESDSENEIDIVILNGVLAELRKSVDIRDIVIATELGALQIIQTQFNLQHDEVEDIILNAVRTVTERNSEVNESDCNINVTHQLLSEIRTTQCVLDLLRMDEAFSQRQVEPSLQLGDQWTQNAGLHDKREQDDEDKLILKAISQLITRLVHCEEALNVVIEEFQAGARAYISSAKDKITRILSGNITMVNNISSCREVIQKCKVHMLHVMEELEPIRCMLEDFGSNYMEDDYSYSVNNCLEKDVLTSLLGQSDLLEANKDYLVQNKSSSDNNYFEGIWFKSHRSTITLNDSREQVLLKSYSNNFGKKVLISELAKLRCLESKFVAPFCGVFGKLASSRQSDEDILNDTYSHPGPVLIFRGDLVPCRMFLSSLEKSTSLEPNTSRPPDDMQAEFMITFVPSLLTALGYIHKLGLVHMELTLDTVTVETGTGVLKLCHICQPRTLTFRDGTADSYICFPPSVLQGGIYEAADDIYAFGLLLWEFLYPHRPPYTEQRGWALMTFIERCSTSETLERDLNMLEPSEGVFKILSGSLRFDKQKCILTPKDLLRQWRDLEGTTGFQIVIRSNLKRDIDLPILESPNNEDNERENVTNQDYLSVDAALVDNQLTVHPDLGQHEGAYRSTPPIVSDITVDPDLTFTSDDRMVNCATVKQSSILQAEFVDKTTGDNPNPPPIDPYDCSTRHYESVEATKPTLTGDQILTSKNRRLDRGAQSFSENLNSLPTLKADTLSRRRSKDDLERRHSFSTDAPNQIGKLLSAAGDKSQKQSGSLFYRLFRRMTPSKSYDFNHVYDEPPETQGKLRISKSERGSRVVPENDEVVVTTSQRVKSSSRGDVRVLSFRISQEM